MLKTLSIVIPIYNVEKYLSRCLDSIAQQNLNQVEVILVNDGSTDNSLSISERYKEKYPNWILINQKNQGLSGARNAGIKRASGRFIWFIDSDDYIINNAIASILHVISENESINIIAIDANIINENEHGRKLRYITRGLGKSGIYSTSEIYRKGYIFPFSGATYYIVKTEFLKHNKLFFKIGVYFEDMLYTPLLLCNCNQCYYLKLPLYIYYIRKGSITTSSISQKKCRDWIGIADELVKKIHNGNFSIAQKKILYDTIARVVGTYYNYCKRLSNKQEQSICKSEYFQRTYLLSSILKSKRYKYILRLIMMKLL